MENSEVMKFQDKYSELRFKVRHIMWQILMDCCFSYQEMMGTIKFLTDEIDMTLPDNAKTELYHDLVVCKLYLQLLGNRVCNENEPMPEPPTSEEQKQLDKN